MCDRAHTWVPCQQHAAFSPVKDADTLRSKKWKKNCKVLLIGATAAQVIKMTQDESVAKPAGGGAGSGAGTGPEAHVNWNDQTMYVPLLCLATLLSASLSFSVLLEMSCSKFSIWFLFSFYPFPFQKLHEYTLSESLSMDDWIASETVWRWRWHARDSGDAHTYITGTKRWLKKVSACWTVEPLFCIKCYILNRKLFRVIYALMRRSWCCGAGIYR